MHPKSDQLRAFLDSELPEMLAIQIQEHLSECAGCRNQFDLLKARANQVQVHLNFLSPVNKKRSPQQAYHQFIQTTRKNQPKKEIYPTMTNRKPLWTALAVVAILAIALMITPVRAWASSFLGLFRVQNITVIQFDPQRADQMGENLSAQQEAIRLILDQNLEMTDAGEKQAVSSVEEAASLAGFSPRIPSALAQAELFVQPGSEGRLTIDQPAMQTVLDAIDANVQLPKEIDGEVVTVSVPAMVIASMNCQSDADEPATSSECVELYQLPSPTVDSPEGLNTEELASAMLQMLGMSAREARQISERIDWTSTLVLPIPQDEDIQVSEIQVDGVTGTLLTGEQEEKFMLLWVKDGFVYGLQANGTADDAQQLVSSMP